MSEQLTEALALVTLETRSSLHFDPLSPKWHGFKFLRLFFPHKVKLEQQRQKTLHVLLKSIPLANF